MAASASRGACCQAWASLRFGATLGSGLAPATDVKLGRVVSKTHFFRQLMIRTDPQVHPFIRSNFRPRRMDGRRKAPISGEQRHEENASHPRKILT